MIYSMAVAAIGFLFGFIGSYMMDTKCLDARPTFIASVAPQQKAPAGSICGNDDELYVCLKGWQAGVWCAALLFVTEAVTRGYEMEGYGQNDRGKGVDSRDDAHPDHAV